MKLAPFRHKLAQASFSCHQLDVVGADAVAFLQGQSTQLLSDRWSIHSFLDRAGKIESHFIAWTHGSAITLLVPETCLPAVLQRFERYVISEDVVWKDNGKKEWWFATGAEVTAKTFEGQLLNQTCWLSPSRFQDAAEVSKAELNYWLEWQGIPWFDQAYQTGNLINQTRLFETAVSLNKGCFPGQEVVAKIYHNRGAAWLPVLLEKLTATPVLNEITIEERIVARLQTGDDENFYHADVLRDVRVEGLVLGGEYKIHFYPRWSTNAKSRAAELFHLGSDCFTQGRESEAQEAWELAVQIDPTYADAYEAIGVLLGRQEKFVEAEGWMRRLLEVDPQSVMAHTNLSLFLMRQNRIQEAEDHKSKATVAQFAVFGKKAADDRQIKEKLEREKEQQLSREKMFQQVLEIDPEDTLANHGLAVIAFERSQFERAKDLLLKVLETDPGHAVTHLWLGKTYLALQDKVQARDIFAAGIKIAAKKGEMMPANEMQALLASLG